ncbi:MAG: ORF6C domain-containing protein [Anaerotignum propionicum]|uniref:Rha family transcriptional regulator n=1 Tax=Anaerotignum propionicum TaxID=28446 RepID=UPI002B205347|nr:ORF6C domain-containing protein [Anaerotignum propionicum]MEA5058047.1 ORF6C domain-containing protein [Anaerotignum propionicum]
MSNLQVLESKATTNTLDSREVAEMVGKGHNELLKDVRRYIGQFNEGNLPHVDFFQENTYPDAKGEERPCFMVTRKGCEFIANKLTGVKGTEFTARYINRFHAMEETIQNTQPNPFEGISTELQAILMQDRKIQVVETRVDKLENTMVVDHGQGKELQTLGKARVMATLLGRESKAYKDKTLSKKVFTAIWHDYKDYFNINSYHNTPVARLDEAKEYLKTWVPSNNLQIEINMVNRGEI